MLFFVISVFQRYEQTESIYTLYVQRYNEDPYSFCPFRGTYSVSWVHTQWIITKK